MTTPRLPLAALAAAALALSACGTAPEDQARDSGEDIGQAIAAFQTAPDAAAAGKAVDEFRAAVGDLKSDTRERVGTQVETQAQTLQDAVAAAQGATDPAIARAKLQQGAQDLRAQADAFRSADNSISVAFWEGVREGYNDEID